MLKMRRIKPTTRSSCETYSRSSWERLTWIEHHQAYQARTRQQRDDLSRVIIIEDDLIVSEEIPEQEVTDDRREEAVKPQAFKSDDQIDFDLRKWDSFDFITVIGVVLLAIGFIAALFPDLRKAGILVPVGLGIMTLGVLGARQKDTRLR